MGGDICNDLKVIPQFVGSCWFNSILMSTLYSQYSRKILIKESKKWDKKDKFFNILKNILKRNYNDPSIAEYYNHLQPQLLLFKFLKKYDTTIEKYIKEKIKNNISNFGLNNFFYPSFIKKLTPKVLDIYHDYKTNTNIINFHKKTNISYVKNQLLLNYNYVKGDITKEKNEILKIIEDVPDYIILYHSKLFKKDIINQGFNLMKTKFKDEAEVHDLSNYNIKIKGIREYDDIITFNGVDYILDSCLIDNFNHKEIKLSHSIVGITCNDNRYVYNGWTKQTFDPAKKDEVKTGNKYPCSLMKYRWNLKKDEEFCLNLKNCNLNFAVDKKDLCFSFTKGDRILVYVRIDNFKTTNLTSLSNDKIKLSDINKLIKDIYQIDNLNKKELINHLLYLRLDIKDFKGVNLQEFLNQKTEENLRTMLLDILNSKYNISLKENSKDKIKDKIKEISKDKIKDFKSRKFVYNKYKILKDFKGKLLKQQVFLSDYIIDEYSSIDKMLIFHGIGTGKTCTAITIVESIINKYKNMKALIILPARLKTNFIDELISENCGLNRYISVDDYNKYNNFNTSKSEKDNIRKKFMKKINENYEIISYESLRIKLMKSNDIKGLINDITKNRIVIIDEIHNLITSRIQSKILDNIIENNKISSNTKMINGVIMRLMTLLANNSSKFFLLTATPVFDNYGQFIELVLNLCPNIKDSELNRDISDLEFLIDKLRGKVSFYKIKDLSAYPKSIIDNIEIPLSKTQDYMIANSTTNNTSEFSNLFCISERQLSISTYGLKFKDKVFSNLTEYAPKLKKLFELLVLDGKHVVYSNFINYCLYLIAEYLKKNGWNNYIEDGIKKYKTFVIWDASLNDDNKQDVKNILNSVSNIDGSNIKIILGSPSIKEGISFKHIQHLHQIDPVWNSSAKTQVEGRCIRYKSHDDIPLNHPTLKREVIIHNYISVARVNGLISKSCDSKIYYEIIKKKAKIISIIEKLLKKVSIDYYLWSIDKSPIGSTTSKISLSKEKEELENIVKTKNKNKRTENKNKNNCPKIRRPEGSKCLNKDYPFIRKNAKGFDCCYKKGKK